MDILHKLLILSLFSFVALFDAQAQQVVGEKNNLLQSKLPSNEEQKSVSGNLFESRQELSSVRFLKTASANAG